MMQSAVKQQTKDEDTKSKDAKYKTNYVMATWICLATIGSVYSMCEAPALHDYWKEFYKKDYSDTFEFYFNLAQSISLFMLIFLSFFIGLLCDMYSNAIVMITQSVVIVLGQFLVYSAYFFNFFWFFFIGRILVFLSMQTIQTSSKSFLNQYSGEKEKGFLFGVHSSCVLMSKCIVLIIQPILASRYGLDIALLFTFLLTCFSLTASYVTYYLETKQQQQKLSEQLAVDTEQQQTNQSLQQQEQQQKEEVSQWQQIKDFDLNFWLYAFIIASSLLVTNVIDALLPAYLSSFWQINTLDATKIASICTLYGFFNWLMGIAYDWLDRDQEWLLFSSFASLFGQLVITQYNPVIGTILVGLGYNMRVIAMLPILSKLVKKESVGKAYGLIRSLKDLITTFAFLIIGIVVRVTDSYQSSFEGVFFYIFFYTIVNILLYLRIRKGKGI